MSAVGTARAGSSPPFIERIRRLGADVEEAWGRTGDEPEAFAGIATAALERHAPHDGFDQVEFASWLGRATGLPDQLDPSSKFGSPPVTLWRSDRFVVDIYFWVDPHTPLHDHGFSGAFGNLIGETFHCIYRLGPGEHPEPGVMLARLDLEIAERLRPGAVRTIHLGRRFVHRVWHISRPTVSLCVRTGRTPLPSVQYTYHLPAIALEYKPGPDEHNALFRKRLAFMRFLATTRDEQLESYVEQLIDGSEDARLTLDLMIALFDRPAAAVIEHLALINRLLERLQSRHGAWIDAFSAALEHRLRENRVAWSMMHDVDQRWLAAVLLTYAERSEIDDAIRRFRGIDDPTPWIADRLTEMIEQGAVRLCLGGFERALLRELILGRPEAEAIAAAMSDPDGSKSAARARDLCAALRQIDILQPLIAAA